MEQDLKTNELLTFFKALSDANRLKIVGLLAKEELSVEQIAEMLDLHPSTVSHHLNKLSKAGLVSARAESYYSIYSLETQVIEEMARHLLAKDALPSVANDVDLDAYDRKVLKNYSTPDGRLKQLPVQQKKLDVILRYLVQQFEPGERYSEKQVNEILARFHEDIAGLRRDLIDFGYMKRTVGGSEYWRNEESIDR